jgi:hypothetical protein
VAARCFAGRPRPTASPHGQKLRSEDIRGQYAGIFVRNRVRFGHFTRFRDQICHSFAKLWMLAPSPDCSPADANLLTYFTIREIACRDEGSGLLGNLFPCEICGQIRTLGIGRETVIPMKTIRYWRLYTRRDWLALGHIGCIPQPWLASTGQRLILLDF